MLLIILLILLLIGAIPVYPYNSAWGWPPAGLIILIIILVLLLGGR